MSEPWANRNKDAVAAHGAKYESTVLLLFRLCESCMCMGFVFDDNDRCLVGNAPDIAEPSTARKGRLIIG